MPASFQAPEGENRRMPATADLAEQGVLDLVHLAHQTFDDRALGRELVQLLEQQCHSLLPVLRGAPLAQRSDAAHTLKGAARAVGAWRLARVMERLEDALADGSADSLGGLLRDLERAVRETRDAAARL